MSAIPSWVVVHTGDFGAAVATEVRRRLPDADAVHTGALPGLQCPPGGLILLATNRPCVDVELTVDRWAMDQQCFLIPVALEHPFLRIGPVLGPRAHATLDCYRRRLHQHHRDREVRRMAEEQYAAEAALQPQGYLPTLVTLAVSTVLELGRRLADGVDDELQQVRLLDVYTLSTRCSRLVGRHGNARSAPVYAEAERSYRALLPVVRDVAKMRGAQ
ncbi:hypothetical protein [Streptomyces sp. bgisy084]|uniref:hypothetical protein n=1 Tax=unclassified Streptomyces TaxID=2593676 RepID=UPI003D71174E